MRLQCQSNGQIINLDQKSTLGHGGEARVYSVPQDQRLVAKVYHQPTQAHAHKLVAMIANPPKNPTAAQWHISMAWPLDVLQTADSSQRVVGFLMPCVRDMHPIHDFYNPSTRSQKCPFFNYRYLHRAARNLTAVVGALHSRGYCIGDVNESNILVSKIALVTLVDTDSFQLRDPKNGVMYRCCVGKPEFTPPELQGKSFRSVDRTIEHDLFGLAVLIFQLLMEGTHPFSGIFQGVGDPPPYSARIAEGHFPYSTAQRGPYTPTLIAPPFEILHPTLRELFIRCFVDGHDNPRMRPSIQTWQKAINKAEKALIVCSANNQHRYGNHLNACPWCERTRLLGGRDPFPSLAAVYQKQHLQPRQKRVSPVSHGVRADAIKSTYPQPTPVSAITTADNRFKLFVCLLGASLGGFLIAIAMVWDLYFVTDFSVFPTIIDTAHKPTTDSASDEVNYDSVDTYSRFSKYQQAIEKYNQLLQSDPDTKAYVNRGYAQYEIARYSGNPDKYYRQALEDLNAAVRLNPNNAEAYLKRGVVRYEIGQYSENPGEDYKQALEDLNAAVRLNPNNAEAYLRRGIVRYKLTQYRGDFNKGYKTAIEDFDSALRRNLNNAEAYLNRGIVYYEIAQYSVNSNTNYTKAVADLQKAANLFIEQGDVDRYLQVLEVCRREQLNGRCE